jgi:hypothetical protein
MSTPTPEEVKAIADEATDLLCTVGAWGLRSSKEDEFWDRALKLKARLEPDGDAARFIAEHGSVVEMKAKMLEEKP